MEFTYDFEANALYVYLQENTKKVSLTHEINDGVHVDLDANGQVLGIEILSPGQQEWPVYQIINAYGPVMSMSQIASFVMLATRYQLFDFRVTQAP